MSSFGIGSSGLPASYLTGAAQPLAAAAANAPAFSLPAAASGADNPDAHLFAVPVRHVHLSLVVRR